MFYTMNKKMKVWSVFIAMLIFAVGCNAKSATTANAANSGKTIYDFTMKDIDGNSVSLSKYKGKIVVIVNTASQCGLVGQLSELRVL